MSESKRSRTRLIAFLLVGSVVPAVAGKYVVPQYMWWLFGLSCLMVAAGSALIIMGAREESDAS